MDSEEMRRRLREDGFCVVPNALSADELERARAGLVRGVAREEAVMGSTFTASLDPNANSVRVNNLPAADPVFVAMLLRPDARAAVEAVLGPHYLVSNFTANIALPGAGSMNFHSDQALSVPAPWPHAWTINVIWVLDDIYEANGATRYLPGSHRFQSFDEVPADAIERTRAFEAPAGSFIAMEGRLWHTSGRNVESTGQRRLLFAYYASDFIRQQANWPMVLPPETQAGMTPETRALFGLAPAGNTRIGGALTRLQTA